MSILTELTLVVGVVGKEELVKLKKDLDAVEDSTTYLTKSALKYTTAMAKQGRGQKEISVGMAKIIGTFSEAALKIGLTKEQMEEATEALSGFSAKGLTATQRTDMLMGAIKALGASEEELTSIGKAFSDQAAIQEQATKSLSARLKAQMVDVSNLGKWWIRIIMFWGVASLFLAPVFEMTNKITQALFEEAEAVTQTRDNLVKLTLTSGEYLRAVGEAEEGTRSWGNRLSNFFHVLGMVREETMALYEENQTFGGSIRVVTDLIKNLFGVGESLGVTLRLLKSEYWGLAVAMSQAGLEEKFLLEKTKQLIDLTTGPWVDATDEIMKSLWDASSSYDMYLRTLVAAGLVEQAAIDRITEHARKIGQLSIEIRNLNAAYEEELGAIQKLYDMLRAVDAENESFRQSVIDLGISLDRDLAAQARRTADRVVDIWRDFRDKLEDIEIEGGYKIQDINQDFSDAMEDLATDIARRREDLDIKHDRKQRDLREKFHRDMKRLENRYAFDLIEAAIHRDAVAIRRLQRRFKYEKGERARKYKEDQEDEYQRYKDSLEDLERYQERKAEDIAKDRERAFRDLEIDLERRREEAEKDRERALRDLEEANRREEREIRKSFDERLKDLKDAHQDKLREIKLQHGRESLLDREQRRAEERLEARHQTALLKLLTGRHTKEVTAMASYTNDMCRLEEGFTIDIVKEHTDRRNTLVRLWEDYLKWMHSILDIFGVKLPPIPPFPAPTRIRSGPGGHGGGERAGFQAGPTTSFTTQMAERRPAITAPSPLGGPVTGAQGLNVNVTVRGEGIMFSGAFEDKLTNKITTQITRQIIRA